MKPLSNAHTHTKYCDGANTPAEMAAAAYKLGFSALGFSGHSFCPEDGFGMDTPALLAYQREVAALKVEYEGKMPIFCGLELDSMSPMPSHGEFDYLIGSVHNITTPEGEVWPVDMSAEVTAEAIKANGGDPYAYTAAYFAAMDEMLSARQVDIVGHFDLVCKFNASGRFFDETAPAYRKSAALVLERHAGKFVFEINTGAMCRYGLTRPYPDYWLWDILKAHRTPVIIGTDSHAADTLDFQLAEMRMRAEQFGLRVVDILDICG